jgi:hypothetical protein
VSSKHVLSLTFNPRPKVETADWPGEVCDSSIVDVDMWSHVSAITIRYLVSIINYIVWKKRIIIALTQAEIQIQAK